MAKKTGYSCSPGYVNLRTMRIRQLDTSGPKFIIAKLGL